MTAHSAGMLDQFVREQLSRYQLPEMAPATLPNPDLYASRRKSLPARLYMTVGELEENPETGMVSGMYRLASQLESRKYKRFFMEKWLFPDEDHCTVIAPSFQAGLK